MTPSLQHHCGVFGISGHPEASRIVVAGLHALQHRGEESAGVWTEHGVGRKGFGLVADVFTEPGHARFSCASAIGHVRYATMGGEGEEHIQPLYEKGVALAHNGTLTNVGALREQTDYEGAGDTGVILHLYEEGSGVEGLIEALRRVEGAWSIVALVDGCLVVGRDPWGFRPLVLGEVRLDEADPFHVAVVAASETTALDYVGARYFAEVDRGEIIVFRDGKLVSRTYLDYQPCSQCIFEQVYFARPDSYVFDQSVHDFREKSGEALAWRCPVPKADVVIAVPDSGVPAAVGYARKSGIPFGVGFVRSHYVGRTFIAPTGRDAMVRRKLSPIPSVVEGKRVVVIDDSLVRGTTSRSIVAMLRDAGAREVHIRIASPPVTGPCYYGIDTPTKAELLATGRDVESMRKFLGCDSLAFLDADGFPETAGYCTACFTGEYPLAVK
jgi:amidophosphoribosyltransferase